MKRFLTSAKTALVAVAMTLVFALQGHAQGYNRIGLSYELETLSQKHADNTNLNGFGIGYLHGFRLSSSVPVYLETGLKMTAGFWSDSETEDDYNIYEYDYNMTKLSLAVPVNASYRFDLKNGMSIQPYLGLNFKFNLLADCKIKESEYDEDDFELIESDSVTINLLKGENAANVFQLGWHVGVVYNYRWLNFGLSYGTDFIKFSSQKPYSVNSSTFNVTVGYNF